MKFHGTKQVSVTQKRWLPRSLGRLLQPPRRAVLNQEFLPAMQAASLEDDETLQSKWAALLANAADPLQRTPVLPAFVEILKELTPEEAAILERFYNWMTRGYALEVVEGIRIGTREVIAVKLARDDSQGFQGIDSARPRMALILNNLFRLGIISRQTLKHSDLQSVVRELASKSNPTASTINTALSRINDSDYLITPFGYAFLMACHEPLKKES